MRPLTQYPSSHRYLLLGTFAACKNKCIGKLHMPVNNLQMLLNSAVCSVSALCFRNSVFIEPLPVSGNEPLLEDRKCSFDNWRTSGTSDSVGSFPFELSHAQAPLPKGQKDFVAGKRRVVAAVVGPRKTVKYSQQPVQT